MIGKNLDASEDSEEGSNLGENDSGDGALKAGGGNDPNLDDDGAPALKRQKTH